MEVRAAGGDCPGVQRSQCGFSFVWAKCAREEVGRELMFAFSRLKFHRLIWFNAHRHANAVHLQDSLSHSGHHSAGHCHSASEPGPSGSFAGISDVVPSGSSTDFQQRSVRHIIPFSSLYGSTQDRNWPPCTIYSAFSVGISENALNM